MVAWEVTGTQSKQVYRGGWGSLLTPKAWPKRAKPPVLVGGGPLGEDRGAGAK